MFLFPLCVHMDPLLRPEFLLLLLEQGERSLEDHTGLFLMLANTTSYPDDVRRWSSRGFRRLCGVDSGEKWIAPHCLPWGWSRQIHSRPRAQPTISPRCGAPARAHRWRRAISRCDQWASAKPSDWAEDRPGSWAQPVRPGARAGDSAHHEGASRGRCERGMELCPLHRGWGWADETSGAAGQWGGVRSSSARSSNVPSSARSSKMPSSARSSKMPAFPPAPASSTAVVWQPPRSPSSPYLYGASPVGLPYSSVAGAGVSLTSASSLWGPDSASARRPSGFTSAPSSLASTVIHRSSSSTGLPRPSGSALVRRRPAIASGLLSSGCASSLRPTGSVGLLPPFSSTWVLSRSCSAADLRSSAFALVARALGSTLAPRILGIPLARWLSVSASGSSTTCSATFGRPPGVGGHHSSMAPPSVGSTVGHHHGCGLGPARLLLLRIPPVSSLAPPSFVTSLVSVSRPPPGCPSSSWAAS